MEWRTEKVGAAIALSENNKLCSRSASKGWGVQLATEWLRKDVTTVSLRMEKLQGEAQIGIVGLNFFPSSWDSPLSESHHSIVLETQTGRVVHKGNATNFIMR